MKDLTRKQIAFCEAYIETGNASEAIRRAGYKTNNPNNMGAENLAKPCIQAYIKERTSEMDAQRVASADEVMRFYSSVMRGEVKDAFGLDVSVADRIKAADSLMKRFAVAAQHSDASITLDESLMDNIAGVFLPVHQDIKNMRHAEYWFKGGRGSTKSSFISIEIILGMLRDDQANAVVYRRVGNTIKDSVYEQLVWALDVLGVSEHFTLRKSPLEIIKTDTGQRIIFRGADDPMKSKSIKLSKGYFKYLWFEELAEYRGMEDVRTIKQSVFRGVDKGITFYSYNPPRSAQSWVNGEALKPREDRLVHHSTYLDVPKEWLKDAFWQEAEALKATNDRAYRNEYMGEVTGTGGNVFENVQVRTITQQEIDSLSYFMQGIDWGWFPDPFHWVRCAFDAQRRRLYIIDEYRTVKTGNQDTFLAVKDKLREDEPLIADSAEIKSISDYKDYGAYWIRAAVKGPGSVDYSMKWLAALSEIIIDTKCIHTAKEFLGYEYERNAQGEFVKGYPDADNHAIDAVRYATSILWRRKGV